MCVLLARKNNGLGGANNCYARECNFGTTHFAQRIPSAAKGYFVNGIVLSSLLATERIAGYAAVQWRSRGSALARGSRRWRGAYPTSRSDANDCSFPSRADR